MVEPPISAPWPGVGLTQNREGAGVRRRSSSVAGGVTLGRGESQRTVTGCRRHHHRRGRQHRVHIHAGQERAVRSERSPTPSTSDARGCSPTRSQGVGPGSRFTGAESDGMRGGTERPSMSEPFRIRETPCSSAGGNSPPAGRLNQPSPPLSATPVRCGEHARSQEDQVQADGSTMAETSELHAACAVLGLTTAPSSSEAKTAFRIRAALLHPDVHQSAGPHRMDAATAAMRQLNDAYQLVLESLAASDPFPTAVSDVDTGVTRRCIKCRHEFQYTADDGLAACPLCGHGSRVRSRNARSSSLRRSPRSSCGGLLEPSEDTATRRAGWTSLTRQALARRELKSRCVSAIDGCPPSQLTLPARTAPLFPGGSAADTATPFHTASRPCHAFQ